MANSIVEQAVQKFFSAFERADEEASVKAVYGNPIEYADKVILPIASVQHYFGLGGGLGSNSGSEGQPNEGVGGGGGGGINARPVALAEISAADIKILPVVDENRAVVAGLAFAAWTVFWTARTLIKIFQVK